MHDQPRIALDLRHIRMVVVDAVPVEGHCRVSEQQHRIGIDRARPDLVGGRRHGICDGLPGLAAIDDVVLVGDRKALRIADLVAHRDEDQRSTATFLHLHVGNLRDARGSGSDGQRAEELDAAPGPHPARQRHRRQEFPTRHVPVGADQRLAVDRQEVEPVRQRRHRVAGVRRGVVAVEKGGEGGDGSRGDDVLAALLAADPVLESFEFGIHACPPLVHRSREPGPRVGDHTRGYVPHQRRHRRRALRGALLRLRHGALAARTRARGHRPPAVLDHPRPRPPLAWGCWAARS